MAVGQRVQLGRARMPIGEAAEKHAALRATGQRGGDSRAHPATVRPQRAQRAPSTPAAAAAATAISASARGSADGATIDLCASLSSNSSSALCTSASSRAFLGHLPQSLREQRMVLAQEAADDEHAVERRELGDRHAEPGRALAPAIGAEVGLAQAIVDVLAAQAAHELLAEVHLLERRMRRHQRADGRSAVRARGCA